MDAAPSKNLPYQIVHCDLPEERRALDAIREAMVATDADLRTAMVALNRSAVGIVLVVQNGDLLVGTLTDGDIRRALLAGATMEAPVLTHMKRNFRSVGPETPRAEVLDLMRACGFQQVPIIDADGSLCGLHLLREIVGAVKRPNWAVIMAGGQGQRLRPLTEHLPKPMIPVAGRPILERIILHMVGFGIQRIFLSINYLGHMVEDYFEDGSRFGCRITYLRETQPLGTAGSLSLLPEQPAVPIVVMNGDLVTQANLGSLLDFHASGPQCATLGIRHYIHTVPFGCLDMEGDRVRHIVEKPRLTQRINTGIYVLDPSVVAMVEHDQERSLPGLLDQCLALGMTVKGFEVEEDWIDVGQWQQVRLAREGAA